MSNRQNNDISGAMGCGALILGAFVLMAYLWFLGFVFQKVVPILGIVSLIVFVGLIFYNYFRALYLGFAKKLPASLNEKPIEKVHAFKNYFFQKAYQDYRDIAGKAFSLTRQRLAQGNSITWNIVTGGSSLPTQIAFLTWPLGLTFYVVFAIGIVIALVSYLTFGVAHLVIVSLVCLLVYITALYLRLTEQVSMAWRRISYICPSCNNPIPLPKYSCPNPDCDAPHEKLVPGVYGLFRRRCQCGTKLPTISFFGRHKLRATCPHPGCGYELNAEIGRNTDIHFPLVGATSAGKSTYLVASALELEKYAQKNNIKMSFPQTQERKSFEESKERFREGKILDKTATPPNAFQIKLTYPNQETNLINIYDVPGEFYEGLEDDRRAIKYFDYTDGILFLIDPFSIDQVKGNSQQTPMRTSKESPQDVYDRFVTTFKSITKRNYKRQPFSLIVSKVDAISDQKDNALTFESSSDRIRQWLIEHGEDNLIRSLERSFSQVQYYATSAQGHDDKIPGSFTPKGVLEPLLWMLSKRSAVVTAKQANRIGWKSESFANTLGVLTSSFVFLGAISLLVSFTLQVSRIEAIQNLPKGIASSTQVLENIASSIPNPFDRFDSTGIRRIENGIELKDGDFNLSERLVYNRSFLIRGKGADKTRIVITTDGDSIFMNKDGVLRLENVSIIRQSSTPGNVIGFSANSGRVEIVNSYISGGSEGNEHATFGITLGSNSSALIKNSVIENSLIGVRALDSATIQIEGSFIQNNRLAGVRLTGNSGAVIQANTIYKNTIGILVMDNSSAEITSNTIQDNQEQGIIFSKSSKGVVLKNQIYRNGYGNDGQSYFQGIGLFNDASAIIEKNTITENAGSGIQFLESSSGTVKGNEITNNAGNYEIYKTTRGLEDYGAGGVVLGKQGADLIPAPIFEDNKFLGNVGGDVTTF